LFTGNYSDDINIIAKQIDYLTAVFINSHNIFTDEIAQENNFINRIKSKVKILQMYSSSPSSDLYYFGNSFDSSDYIDFSKMDNKDQLPLIDNGQMTLSSGVVKNWVPRSIFIAEGSNGYRGNNHAVYASSTSTNVYKYFFEDTPTIINQENIRDNNPLTFFEYEQINIENKKPDSKEFEYKYIVNPGPGQPIVYDPWSSFKGESLLLNIVMEKEMAESANFVKIIPYFGSAGYIVKDVTVKSIEVVDELNVKENILTQPIYISSSFIPSSIDKVKNFYYREAKISFSERKVKSIKISFEQSDSIPVNIKHIYYKPSTTGNPYSIQERFDPNSPLVTSENFSSIPWSTKTYNINELIPSYNQPNFFKSETQNTKTIDVKLSREIPIARGFVVKVKSSLDGSSHYITNRFWDQFLDEFKTLTNYPDGITDSNYKTYINNSAVSSLRGYDSPFLSSINSSNMKGTPSADDASLYALMQDIVTWLNTTTTQKNSKGETITITKEEKFAKFKLDTKFNAVIEEVSSQDTKPDNQFYKVPLVRQEEILNAKRRSIGIRDVTIGHESYSDKAIVVSRQYDTAADIEYLTLSAETGFSGKFNSAIAENIKYYISLDDGSKWIQISSIEDPFSSVPEVVAFNQNIDENFRMPGVSYLSQPDIPASVRKFILKIEITKPTGENITPIIYSYKVGVKVKQS
jgi:hypothetical protein